MHRRGAVCAERRHLMRIARIALIENLVSNAERRGLATGEKQVWTRVCDLQSAVSAVSGKLYRRTPQAS